MLKYQSFRPRRCFDGVIILEKKKRKNTKSEAFILFVHSFERMEKLRRTFRLILGERHRRQRILLIFFLVVFNLALQLNIYYFGKFYRFPMIQLNLLI